MGKTYYKRVFEFGKIAFVPFTKTKKCLVDIKINIRDAEVIRWVNGKKEVAVIGREISFIGNIWNGGKTDCYSCGQNSKTIAEHFFELQNRVVLKVILTMWEKYHLCMIDKISKEDKELIKEVLDIDIDKYIVA